MQPPLLPERHDPGLSEMQWRAVILILTAIVLSITLFCLSQGITTIFMHVYYFPIILLAYRYRWRGFGPAVLLALTYPLLVFVFYGDNPGIISVALYRFLVFVGIAAMVAWLSDRTFGGTFSRAQEVSDRYLSLVPAIVLMLDRGGRITFLNGKGCEILECPEETVTGESWIDTFIPETERENVRSIFRSIIGGDLSHLGMVENQVVTRKGRLLTVRWYNTPTWDAAGGISGIISYGEDITEERMAQDELHRLQQFQENIITSASIWISVLSPDGTILVWNEAAEKISGYRKAEVIGRASVWKRMYPDAKYRRDVRENVLRIINSDSILEEYETDIRCADGTSRSIVWNSKGLRDKGGAVYAYIAIGRDVSAQRAAEMRAGESSQFLATMINTLPLPVFFKDADGRYLGCNPPFEEYIGIRSSDLIGKTVYDIAPKELADRYFSADRELFKNPVPQQYETQVQFADGSRHDVIFYKAPFFDKDGSIAGLIGAFLDISDRKQAELDLKKSEEKFRIIADYTFDWEYWITPDGTFVYMTPSCERVTGYTAGEFYAQPHLFEEIIHPDDRAVYSRHVEKTRVSDNAGWVEYRIIRKDGTLRWISHYCQPMYGDDGSLLGRRSTNRDITTGKASEIALRESEEKYRAFFTTSKDCVFITTLDGHWVDFNDAAVDLFGYDSREDLMGTDIAVLYANPDDRAAHIHHIREHGYSSDYPADLRKKDGTIIHTLITTVARTDSSGAITGFQGTVRDITGQKAVQDRIDELLRVQQEQLRIIDASPAIAFLWRAEENWPVEMVSTNISQFGFVPEDFLSGRVLYSSVIHPDDLEKVAAEVEYNSTNNIDEFVQVYRLIGKDNKTYWIDDYTHIRRDESGKITHYDGIVVDITERKRMEDALEQSEKRFRNLVETTADMIWEVDGTGAYTYVSPRIYELLGYTPAEVMGKTPFDFMQPGESARVRGIFDRLVTTRVPFASLENFGVHKDGHIVILESSGVPIFSPEGVFSGYRGIDRDITERRQILETLHESERKFRDLFENSRDGIAIAGMDTRRFVDCNEMFLKMLGYNSNEIRSLGVDDIHPEDSLPHILESFERMVKGEIGTIQNALVRRRDKSVFFADISAYPISISGNFYAVGVFRDVTERNRAEEELRQSRQKLAAAMDLAKMVSWELDVASGMFTFDDRFYAFYGTTAEREGGPLMSAEVYAREFLHPDDQYMVAGETRMAIETTDPDFTRQIEHRIIRRDGEIRDIVVRFGIVKDADGKTIRTYGANQDITERKRAEVALKESEHRSATLLEAIPDMMFILSRDGVFRDFRVPNESVLAMPAEKIIGSSIRDTMFDEESVAAIRTQINKALETRQLQLFEYELPLPSGPRQYEARITALNEDEVLGIVRDITQRKQDEHERERIRSWHEGVNQILASILSPVSLDEKFRIITDGVVRTFGADFCRIWVIDKGDLCDTDCMHARVTEGPHVCRYRDRCLHLRASSGRYTHIDGKGHRRVPFGAYKIGLVASGEENKFLINDVQSNPRVHDPAWAAELGLVGFAGYQLRPPGGDVLGVFALFTKFPITPDMDALLEMLSRSISMVIQKDSAERALIESERQTRESRQLFADIISFLPDPTMVIDRNGTVLAWNRALEQISGVPAEDIIGRADYEYSLWMYGKRRPILIDLVFDRDKDAARMNYVNIRRDQSTIMAETQLTLPSGKNISLSMVASPLFDEKGQITGAIQSLRDITSIKKTEEELARLNARLEQIVKERTRALEEEVAQRIRAEENVKAALEYNRSVIEANPDLMVVLDNEGRILDVNTAGEVLTGIPKSELIGTLYFGYLEDDGTLETAFARLMAEGSIENAVRIRRTDGHQTPLSVHATVVRSAGSTQDRIIVSAHDISRQKADEEAIRASLDEKVVLLREVHHRVKNNLQIIISLTNLQMRKTTDPGARQIMAETQNRVRAMSLVHEKLYRSESLSQIDFADYTRFLATQLFSFYGLETRRVRLDFTFEKIMVDINTAVPLGLIMNELVSNALKHAFPNGREGTLSITGVVREDTIILTVRDNGVGIPAGTDWRKAGTLGMRLITSLVDQIDGSIEKEPGEGTIFTVRVPRPGGKGGPA